MAVLQRSHRHKLSTYTRRNSRTAHHSERHVSPKRRPDFVKLILAERIALNFVERHQYACAVCTAAGHTAAHRYTLLQVNLYTIISLAKLFIEKHSRLPYNITLVKRNIRQVAGDVDALFTFIGNGHKVIKPDRLHNCRKVVISVRSALVDFKREIYFAIGFSGNFHNFSFTNRLPL